MKFTGQKIGLLTIQGSKRKSIIGVYTDKGIVWKWADPIEIKAEKMARETKRKAKPLTLLKEQGLNGV